MELDFVRENSKIKKQTKKKNEDCFFYEKEIVQIRSMIPEVKLCFY